MTLKYSVSSMKDAQKLVERFVEIFVFEYSLAIQEEAKINVEINGMTDTGQLRDSILLIKTDTGYTIVASASYSVAVEYGSMPHWAPIEPLKGWARRKLGDEKAAWAVQHKIAKEGTTAKPFMDPAIEGAFDEAWTRTMRRMGG